MGVSLSCLRHLLFPERQAKADAENQEAQELFKRLHITSKVSIKNFNNFRIPSSSPRLKLTHNEAQIRKYYKYTKPETPVQAILLDIGIHNDNAAMIAKELFNSLYIVHKQQLLTFIKEFVQTKEQYMNDYRKNPDYQDVRRNIPTKPVYRPWYILEKDWLTLKTWYHSGR